MTPIDYIKIAFVCAGAMVIVFVLGMNIIVKLRRAALRSRARELMASKRGVQFEERAREFLSNITVTDMCADSYLKSVVDDLLQPPTQPQAVMEEVPA